MTIVIAGCNHTRTTDATRAQNPGSPTGTAPETNGRGGEGTGAEGASVAGERVRSDNGIPLATSAEGLLVPNGERAVRQKLSDGGFLKDDSTSTRAGLLRFQREHDLPATGAPDAATLRKLGLDPEKLLRHAGS